MNARTLAVAALAALSVSAFAPVNAQRPPWITAGPMIGHVTHDKAIVWLQVAPGVPFVAEGTVNGNPTPAPWVLDLGDGCHRVGFERLPEAATLRVRLRHRDVSDSAATVDVRLAPPPSQSGKVVIAFGSCAKLSQFGRGPAFVAMAKAKPDVALFVGDNSYFVVGDGGPRTWATTGPDGDWSSAERMLARHLVTRRNEDVRELLRTTPSYAVWDDHDYGPNNADRAFANKDAALRTFQKMWANPGFGTDAVPGVFSSFRRGPVEVFLMDDRYHKWVATADHPDVTAEQATIWGEGQFRWLCERLKASDAPVKVIANGTQFCFQGKSGEGHWQEARREHERLMAFLVEEQIGGVVFLTGDRHHTELMRVERADGGRVYDFTSSPLQQMREIGPLTTSPNPSRVWGMSGNSFGLVTIDVGADGEGSITFEARDESGVVPVVEGEERKTVVPLAELRGQGLGAGK